MQTGVGLNPHLQEGVEKLMKIKINYNPLNLHPKCLTNLNQSLSKK